jgi:hypothetical protein
VKKLFPIYAKFNRLAVGQESHTTQPECLNLELFPTK